MEVPAFEREIKKVIEKDKLAIIVGAGVTIGAVANSSVDCTWRGLVKSGLIRCKELNKLSDEWLNRKLNDLHEGDFFSLLSATLEVEMRLKHRHPDDFSSWLKEEIGQWKIVKTDVLDALKQIKAIIATTNYDDFLRQTIPDLEIILWSSYSRCWDVLNGRDKGIVHLHGYYREANSVILGVRSYDEIVRNEYAQVFQKNLVTHRNLLFVGCGEGLNDPNFGLLLEWMGDKGTKNGNRHYILLREQDEAKINSELSEVLRKANVNTVIYGVDFEELAPFLNGIASLEESPKDYLTGLARYHTVPIGRKSEIEHLKSLLKDPSLAGNVITIKGAPGIGKTLLAVQVAKELATERIFTPFFISLAPISDPKYLSTEIARTIGYPQMTKVSDLVNYLQRKPYLLILDNFEQLIGAEKQLEELISQCTNIRWIITSQRPLNLPLQKLVEVEPLSYPKETGFSLTIEALNEYPAINLFVERAKRAKPQFELSVDNAKDVISISTLAGGLPLAIEIFAAYTDFYSLPQIIEKVEENITSITITPDMSLAEKRHLTLHNALNWSYRLLSQPEQALFRTLCIFEGGFTFSAAEHLCKVVGIKEINVFEGLRLLKNRSLLEVVKRLPLNGDNRYVMLEPVRLFGLHQLKKLTHYTKLRQYHASYFLEFTEEAESKLTSGERESGRWLERIDEDYENLRSVFEWCLESNNEHCELGLRIASNLFWYWNLRGRLSEGFHVTLALFERIETLDKELDALDKELLAKTFYTLGGLAFLLGKYEKADKWLQESADLWKNYKLKGKEVDRRRWGLTLVILGVLRLNSRTTSAKKASQHLKKAVSVFQEIGDNWGLALAKNDLGRFYLIESEWEEAQKLFVESLTLWESMEDDWGEPLTLICLGELMTLIKQYDEAFHYLNKALNRQKPTDKWGRALVYKFLAKTHLDKNDLKLAAKYYLESLQLHRELNRQQLIAECLEGIGELASRTKQPVGYVLSYLQAAEYIRKTINAPLSTHDQIRFNNWKQELLIQGALPLKGNTAGSVTNQQTLEFVLNRAEQYCWSFAK